MVSTMGAVFPPDSVTRCYSQIGRATEANRYILAQIFQIIIRL